MTDFKYARIFDKNLQIIGISGKIGCGKSTVASFLQTELADSESVMLRLSLGDLVKEEASEIYGFNLKDCYTQEGKNKILDLWDILRHMDPTQRANRPLINPAWYLYREGLNPYQVKIREILQWYGTEVTRARDEDYWVNALHDACSRPCYFRIHNKRYVIVDDMRFKNEFKYIKDQCGTTIRIEPYNQWLPGQGANHASETDLDDMIDEFDLIYRPNYGDSELQKIAKDISKYILAKGK